MSERTWFRRSGSGSYPGEMPDGVIGRAVRDGWRAGQVGAYDEWSFTAGEAIPYFARLEAEEGIAVLTEKANAEQEVLGILKEHRLTSDQQAVDTMVADAEEAWLRRERDHFLDRRQITLAYLDNVTGVHEPLPPDYEPEASPTEQPPADPEAEAILPIRPGRWPGPADGTLAPPVPHWLKILLVLLLAFVELPIYFASFRPFDRSVAMVALFTVPVAVSMVLGPHLTGIWLRRRLAEPSAGRLPVIVSGCIMAVWLAATVLLAALRRNALLAPQTVEGRTFRPDLAGISPTTITAVFALLLVISGLLSFMLGLADDHPGVTALHEAHEAADAMAEAHLDAVAECAEAHHDGVLPLEDELAGAERELEARIGAIRMEYQAARAAYLDAVVLAVADPSVTLGTSAAVHEAPQRPPNDRRFWRTQAAETDDVTVDLSGS